MISCVIDGSMFSSAVDDADEDQTRRGWTHDSRSSTSCSQAFRNQVQGYIDTLVPPPAPPFSFPPQHVSPSPSSPHVPSQSTQGHPRLCPCSLHTIHSPDSTRRLLAFHYTLGPPHPFQRAPTRLSHNPSPSISQFRILSLVRS